MEDRYYVPKLNEFHMDFEYEYLDNDIWYKAKPTEISAKDFDLQTYGLRVKYLDKEDIESLGFIDSIEFFTRNDIRCQLYLLPDNKVDIYNHEGDNMFTGIIKNKSELKKLLAQLEIYEKN